MCDVPLARGGLKILDWASAGPVEGDRQHLLVDLGLRPTPMPGSPATGRGLVTNGLLGGDVIRLAAGEAFEPHTHPGDHLLIVIGGEGTITFDGVVYPTRAGQIYMVEGSVSHAVGAITDHVILAVGSPHKAVDDPTRMTPVEYQSVLSAFGDMHCLICDQRARFPQTLADVAAPDCPCRVAVKGVRRG